MNSDFLFMADLLAQRPTMMLYSERGELRMNDEQKVSFFKEYIYLVRKGCTSQLQVDVHFLQNPISTTPPNVDKGTFFHSITFNLEGDAKKLSLPEACPSMVGTDCASVPSMLATHLCDADTYRGYSRLITCDEFTSEWRVTGPKKNYTIVNVFKRTNAP